MSISVTDRYIIIQRTMPVALWNVGCGQAALLALHLLALAGARDPFTLVVDHPHQPDSITDRTYTHLVSSVAQRLPMRSGALRVPYCGKARLWKAFCLSAAELPTIGAA